MQTVLKDGALIEVESVGQPTPEELKEIERSQMRVTRGEFAVACVAAEIITADEAKAWAGGNALPAAVSGIIATLPPADILPAEIEALTTAYVRRTAPLLETLRIGLGLTPEEADALFG